MNKLQKMKLNSLIKKAKKLAASKESGKHMAMEDEIKIQLDLAHYYDKFIYDSTMPYARLQALEHYRNAATMGSAEAQYTFATRKIEQGKFWQQWAQAEYGRDIHRTYAKHDFDEGLTYLQEAQANGYALATRFHGMVYIHGWGVEQDKDRGFKLVVQSIEEEGSWDKATEIFEKLGLNTPEFFSGIMALKNRSKN